MTKQQSIGDIMYVLKYHNQADFEVDDKSYSISPLFTGGYVIESTDSHIKVPNKTVARKEIAKLGRTVLCL